MTYGAQRVRTYLILARGRFYGREEEIVRTYTQDATNFDEAILALIERIPGLVPLAAGTEGGPLYELTTHPRAGRIVTDLSLATERQN